MHLYLLTFSAFNVENYRQRDDPTALEVAVLVLNYVLCIPVLIAVGLFTIYHYWNLASNVGAHMLNRLDFHLMEMLDYDYRRL
jgi:hypothetical protein